MIGIDRQFVLSRNLPFTSSLSCSRKDHNEYLFLHLHSRDDGVQETDNVVLTIKSEWSVVVLRLTLRGQSRRTMSTENDGKTDTIFADKTQ